MKWNVRVARDAERQLAKAPRDYQTLIRTKLWEMAEDLFRGDVVPLKGTKWQGGIESALGDTVLSLSLTKRRGP